MHKIIAIIFFAGLMLHESNASGKGTEKEEKVKGGFRECNIYNYTYKSGQLDNKSEKIHTKIKYDDSGRKIEETIYKHSFNKKESDETWKYVYDKHGNKVNVTILINEQIYLNYLMNYKNNNLVEKTAYTFEGKIRWKYIYHYNENGFKIGEISIGPDSSTIWKTDFHNDDKGLIIQEIHYNKNDSTIKEKIIYKNNDKGKISERTSLSQNNSIINKTIFRYNNNDDISEIISYDSDSSLKDRTTFLYDKDRNRIEIIIYRNDDSIYNKSTFKYDEYGNRIEEVEYNSKNVPESCKKYIYSK